VTSWPEERARSHALGVYGAVVSTGFASGAVLGGLLVQESWRLVFFVNAPIGLLLLACYWLLPASAPTREGGLDLPGAVTGTAGVALIVLAVAQAGDTLRVTGPLLLALAAVLLLVGFVLRERRAATPLLDLSLFADRGIRGRQPVPAVGRRIQRRPGTAFDAVPARRKPPFIGADRPVLPAAGGRGVPAIRPASRMVHSLGPRRSLAISMVTALASLCGSAAAAVASNSIIALLAALLLMGV
jgi:hypothetical protein